MMRIAYTAALVLFLLGGMANAQGQVSRLPIFWKMNLPEDAAAWRGKTASCTSEGLVVDVKTSATAIVLRRELDTNKYNTLDIELAIEPSGLSKARLFWNDGRGFRQRSCVDSGLVDSTTERFSIRLDLSPRWRGKVRELRFHPANRPCRVLVRSLKLYYRPPPSKPPPRDIQWVKVREAPKLLKETSRPVMFYIFRIGNAQCQALAATTFKDQSFVQATQRFVCVRLLPEDLKDFQQYVGNVIRTPAFVFGQRDPQSGKFVVLESFAGYHSLEQFMRYFKLVEQKLLKRTPQDQRQTIGPRA